MPLITPAPVEKETASSVLFDKVVIQSVYTDHLWTRSDDELFTHSVERFLLLNGVVVNAKVVPIPANVLASELARPEVAEAYEVIRQSNYRMLQAVNEAPSEAELVE